MNQSKSYLVKKEVSVVMAVHRLDKFVFIAIESILSQADVDLELVIVINGPQASILKSEIKKAFDYDNVYLIVTSIPQLSYALNLGVEHSSSHYVARMDSDDISDRFRLRKQLDYMIKNNLDLLGSDVQLIDENGMIIGERKYPRADEIRRVLYFSNPFCHPSIIIKKELLVSVRGYNAGFASEDYDLWLRLARESGISWSNYPEPLLKYRVHDNSSQRSKLAYAECVSLSIRELLLGFELIKFFACAFHLFKFFFRTKNIH